MEKFPSRAASMAIKKAAVAIVLMMVFIFCWKAGLNYFEPQISTDIALGQAAYDSTAAHNAVRAYSGLQNALYNVPVVVGIAAFFLTLASIWSGVKKLKQAEAAPPAGRTETPKQ